MGIRRQGASPEYKHRDTGSLKKEVAIHIGGVYGSATPAIIYTLLGSCVAVCLFDPARKIGGMNHILLPGQANLRHYNASTRFGINAMEVLINRMMQLGASRHRLVAKIFGGAHVLPHISLENGTGRKITHFVCDFLRKETIPIISKDVGGQRGRKIFFHTDTGIVLLKRIAPTQSRFIRMKEEKAIPGIKRKIKKSGQITFFH